MQSECCGAFEWIDGTGICNECREHAEFIDFEEDDIDIDE